MSDYLCFSFLRSSMKWLCVMVLCLSMAPAYAADDIQLPPRTSVWDQAGILGDSAEIFQFSLETLPVQMQSKGMHLYIVTVQDAYRPYMKEFIASICSGWHICDNNNDVLLVMTDAYNPWVYVYAGADNKYIPEPLTHYLAEDYLPGYPSHKTAASIASDFIYAVSTIMTEDEFLVKGDRYRTYQASYKAGTPENAERLEMPDVPWYARFFYRALTVAVMITALAGFIVLLRVRDSLT